MIHCRNTEKKDILLESIVSLVESAVEYLSIVIGVEESNRSLRVRPIAHEYSPQSIQPD